MTSNYILDTSFISSLVNENDINHQKSTDIYIGLPGNAVFYAPRTVELELYNFFSRVGVEIDLSHFLHRLGVQWVDIDAKFAEKYAGFINTMSGRQSTIDTTLLAVLVESFGAKLLTFDRQLAKKAKRISGK